MLALLHSMEDDQHTHTQEKVECEVVKMNPNGYEAIFITPNGVKCTGIFNPWLGWMVDDKYGIIKED